MCGIVGYIGRSKNVGDILLEGLKRLEYRGYDSAGIAIVRDGELFTDKMPGKIKKLEEVIGKQDLSGSLGIAHTRWATHGEPNRINAHPHYSADMKIAIVHNGIIENYITLKKSLIAEGCEFRSDTDTAPVGLGLACGMPPKEEQLPTATMAAAPAATSFSISTLLMPAMVE